MSKLPVYVYDDITALYPHFDPVERGYITLEWRGNALDVLRWSDASASNRLWLVLHVGWIPGHILHEFALWCAEQVLALIPEPDPRFVAALEVKRRWIKDEATYDELRNAYSAASSAATKVYFSVPNDTSRSNWAAETAAVAVTRAALLSASEAAKGASNSAAGAAAYTVDTHYTYIYDTAHEAAYAAQVTHLIGLLEAYKAEQ